MRKALSKIQLDWAFRKGATLIGSRGGCSGVHGMISMVKPLDFLVQLVVSLKSTVGFVSNLN